MMTYKWIWLGAIAGALALAGGCNCGNPDPTPGEEDAGTGGVETDAGVTDPDAGDDAGMVDPDAGEELDGGDADAGEVADAGEQDAGMMEQDAGMDAGVTPTNLCADVAKKKCDYFIRCKSDGVESQGRPNDAVTAQMRAECEAFETTRACQVIAEGWSLNRAVVDQVKYLGCIDESYPAATCARDLNKVLACQPSTYIKGATPNGMLCTDDLECSAGYCSKMAGATCGTCTAFVAVGQNCPNGNECDSATTRCSLVSGQCQAYLALGAGCFIDDQCGPGNVCALTGGGGGRVCKVGVALGGMCTGARQECARHADPTLQNGDVPETICSVNTGTGTCIPVQAALGGACGTGERYTANTMQRGPFCNETEFCSAGGCTPRRPAGGPCTSSDVCAFGTYCDNTGMLPTNTCVAYKELGGICTSSAQCKNFMTCATATCAAALSKLGAPCNMNQPCAEGYCDPGTNMCTALKADGAMCGGNLQCESGSCVAGLCAKACWQ